jgi:hypothetical protein
MSMTIRWVVTDRASQMPWCSTKLVEVLVFGAG